MQSSSSCPVIRIDDVDAHFSEILARCDVHRVRGWRCDIIFWSNKACQPAMDPRWIATPTVVVARYTQEASHQC